MKYRKITPYKLGLTALIGLPLLLTACKHKEILDPEPAHHNTTYVWGNNNWGAIKPVNKVAASADSTLVDFVFLQNDGKLSGIDVVWVRQNMEYIINTVTPENRYKVRGVGDLKYLYITDKADSVWLSQFGFKFVEPRYKQK